MKPHKNHVLVKPFPSENISMEGIIVPDSVQERNNKGWVIEVGAGTKEYPMIYKKGDVVHNIQGAGEPVEEGGELLFLIKTRDILAFEN